MTDSKFDLAIVGAGIVGLASALSLTRLRPDLRLIILEKEGRVAAHQTGNNSGVIHAGLYYKPGSLKAKMAVEGARCMIEFCQEHDLPYELCGKVVVATTEEEVPRLDELYRRGVANGVPGLVRLSAGEIADYEPHAQGVAGVWSPKTGIVDYLAVTAKYAELIQQAGATIRFNSEVTGIEERDDEVIVQTSQGEVQTRALINCAGLQSDLVARMTGSTEGVRIVGFRGEYYKLAPESSRLVRGLVYPVPDPRFPFLGVHFTKKIDGSVEAGPNAVLAFAREGYAKSDISPGYVLKLVTFPGFWAMAAKYWKMGLAEMWRSYNKRAFVKALQVLVPEVRVQDVTPGGVGVRAQAMDNKGNLLDDFRFLEAPRAIHVLNAPSPAATASLAIGEYIAQKALASFGY
ncbi:MAG TPA: L-2-hydroxyglutarate oxidase [Anaerolineae bacterium]|nr:L-2-hydroxyglutarate oxidase [Anaerolineae bacterium]